MFETWVNLPAPSTAAVLTSLLLSDCFGRGIKLSLVVKDIVMEINAVWVVADANRLAQTSVNLLLNGNSCSPESD